jgi:hypothetical protein
MRPTADTELAGRYATEDPFRSAAQAAHAVQAGEVTAEELLAMLVARIAASSAGYLPPLGYEQSVDYVITNQSPRLAVPGGSGVPIPGLHRRRHLLLAPGG